ncbi:MAG: dihydrofolate reductase, partial [Rickettsiales bacterium]|nr:dihydrofolate reductase [Rickettsiales bacterium]
MKISIVVAKGRNGQIGKDNQLLWRIRDDLQNFKKLTTNHHILMGRNTFESIGKPLPNRINMIIT